MSRRLVIGLALFAAACGGNGSPTEPTPSSGSSGSFGPATTADLVFCVDETNRYRSLRGRPALTRSSTLEAYAAEGAQEDGQAHAGHRHFQRTQGGGIAFAENELPWWPTAQFQNVRAVMASGIAGFYGEGPGGGHYDNMMGGYTQVGCGVYIANGEITVVQNFR